MGVRGEGSGGKGEASGGKWGGKWGMPTPCPPPHFSLTNYTFLFSQSRPAVILQVTLASGGGGGAGGCCKRERERERERKNYHCLRDHYKQMLFPAKFSHMRVINLVKKFRTASMEESRLDSWR